MTARFFVAGFAPVSSKGQKLAVSDHVKLHLDYQDNVRCAATVEDCAYTRISSLGKTGATPRAADEVNLLTANTDNRLARGHDP